MTKRPLLCYCHNVTTFTESGELDEDAYRFSVQRLVDCRLGISASSGGSGEGHSLTHAELRRIYLATVAVGKGKVIVESNQPDQHTAQLTIEYAQIAIDAGLERVGLYGPAGLHGYRATAEEFILYFDHVFAEIGHPVMLNANPMMAGASAATIATICNKYPQVTGFAMSGHAGDGFMIELQDRLKRPVDFFVAIPGSFNSFGLGAAGIGAGIDSLIPKTIRRYLDCYDAGDLEGAMPAYRDLRRLERYAYPWKSAWPRPFKMAMKILKLPGAGIRLPYVMANEAEVEKFKIGLFALNIPEIDELARAAGVK